MCHCYHQKSLVAKEGKVIVGELSCHQWRCPDCGPKRHKRWYSRFEMLAEQDVQFQVTLCLTEKDRDNLTQRVHRADGSYITVHIGDTFEVFHTAIRGNRQFAPDKTTWMTPRKMLGHARMVLDKAISGKHRIRISASRSVPFPLDWNGNPKTWVHIAKTPLSIEELNRRLDARGYGGYISLGEVFPAYYVKAFIGEDFQLKAVGSEQTQRVIRAMGSTWDSLIDEGDDSSVPIDVCLRE